MAFQGDESFGVMVRSILDDVLNGSDSGPSLSAEREDDGGRRTAELLAKHVDMRFKDAKASVSPEASSTSSNLFAAAIAIDANESFQNDVFALFRHLHSKDVFEAFYKRDLAKRLLTGRAVSTDMEWSFLTKLKAECGAAYTSKMEGMFKDMELSRDIMSSYAAYSAGAATSSAGAGPVGKMVDMDVQVLTTGYWPVYPKYPNLILPPELLGPRTKFENYYTEKYQGRRITWQYSLGNCIVKACFPKSAAPKELVVNMCQSLVLLCFNVGVGEIIELGLTLDDIMKKTGIDDRPELERVLQSLSMGRDGTRVLRKVDYDNATQPMSSSKTSDSNNDLAKKQRVRRNVGPYDRFFFNSSFTSNQRRIRITNITMKETSEERTKTHEAVSNDRLWCIDAAVVRIMKARKAIDHRDLIGEVMAQLKFPATAADIKKRIEGLIEREYMERVEGDRSKYKYLA
jgi:cullin-4